MPFGYFWYIKISLSILEEHKDIKSQTNLMPFKVYFYIPIPGLSDTQFQQWIQDLTQIVRWIDGYSLDDQTI